MTAANRGTQIHGECELFVTGKGDFTKNMKKFAGYFDDIKTSYELGDVTIEEDWGFTIDWEPCGYWDDNVWLRMKLDNFITRERDDAGDPTKATPTDYKTGKKFGNEVSHNQQGQIYVLGSFMRFPTLEEADIQFKYLDHGLETKKVYVRSQAMKLLPYWNKRLLRLTQAEDFPPKPNKVTCMWCPYGPQHGDSSCEWGV